MNLCTIRHCRREQFHRSKLLPIHFRSANDFHRIEFEKEVSLTIDQIARPEHHFSGVKVIVGVDRLDYIKGVPQELHALELFFIPS